MPSVNEARLMPPAKLRALTEKTEMESLGASILDFLERPGTERYCDEELCRSLLRAVVRLKDARDRIAEEWGQA